MSVKVRRKLRKGMTVWVETGPYLAGGKRGWVAGHCYRAEVTYVGRPTPDNKWVTIELVQENQTWHRTFTDRVKVVKICA